MKPSPKHLRMAAVVVVLAVLTAAVYWSARSGPKGSPSPADCVDAYCDAGKGGDAGRYLNCLAEPLRAEIRQRFSANGQLTG